MSDLDSELGPVEESVTTQALTRVVLEAIPEGDYAAGAALNELDRRARHRDLLLACLPAPA